MTARVFSSLERYRGAIGELPETTTAASSPQGAIVVVDGAGAWWDDCLRAAASGAVGIVVSAPGPAPTSALDRLTGLPIVLERPLVRADVASDLASDLADGRPAASALVVECHAPRPALAGALRDALAWAAVFAAAPLKLHTATFSGARGMALIDVGDEASVALVVGASAGAPRSGRLRVTSLGETRRELEVDGGETRFAVTDAASRRLAPTRFERPERLALRRLAAAVEAGVIPDDLAGYARDSALAEAILRSGGVARPEPFTS